MLDHWTDDYVSVNGDLFHYTRTGSGNKPPFVLLHGFSDNGLCWRPIAQELERDYDVIMPDARGHGLSARLPPNEPRENAADMAGFISAMGMDKPIVGGHSMGASAAAELGATHPQLVGRLILEDPAWFDPPPEDSVNTTDQNPFATWLHTIDALPITDIIAQGKEFSPTWADAEFPAWAESKKQLDKSILNSARVYQPWREVVSNLTMPTLLITADTALQAIVSPAVAQEAAELCAHLLIAHIPNAGHNIRRENGPAFMEAINNFLGQTH